MIFSSNLKNGSVICKSSSRSKSKSQKQYWRKILLILRTKLSACDGYPRGFLKTQIHGIWQPENCWISSSKIWTFRILSTTTCLRARIQIHSIRSLSVMPYYKSWISTRTCLLRKLRTISAPWDWTSTTHWFDSFQVLQAAIESRGSSSMRVS